MSQSQSTWQPLQLGTALRYRPVTALPLALHDQRRLLVQQCLDAHRAKYAVDNAYLTTKYGRILASWADQSEKEREAKKRASDLIVQAQPFFGGYPPNPDDLVALDHDSFVARCQATVRRLESLAGDLYARSDLQRDHGTRNVAFDVATRTNAMTDLQRQQQMRSIPSQTNSQGEALERRANDLSSELEVYFDHRSAAASFLDRVKDTNDLRLILYGMPHRRVCMSEGEELLALNPAAWATKEQGYGISLDYQAYLDGFYSNLFRHVHGYDM